MAKRLGYGGLANTNGARDFSGKEEAEAEGGAFRFRSNDTYNRRRYGGLWYPVLFLFLLT